jgi:alpha-1,3-rhamnosyltransferase
VENIVRPEIAESLPLVTVIIPSYNHRAYVADAISSVLAQTYPAVELIVIDDGSSDGSAEIIAALAEHHDFTFIRNERNIGLNSTLTAAFGCARGEYIGTLASDDLYASEKVERQVTFLQDHGLDGVYASGFKLFDDGRKELINQKIVERHFLAGTILQHIYISDSDGPLMQSGLFSAEMVRAIDPVRRHYKSDDHMFMIKALEGYRIGYMPEALFYYRVHETNTHRNHWRTFAMRTEIAASLTPERLRPKFLANILHSQAEFLFLNGRRGVAIKFLFASFALWPSPRRIARTLAKGIRGVIRHG